MNPFESIPETEKETDDFLLKVVESLQFRGSPELILDEIAYRLKYDIPLVLDVDLEKQKAIIEKLGQKGILKRTEELIKIGKNEQAEQEIAPQSPPPRPAGTQKGKFWRKAN